MVRLRPVRNAVLLGLVVAALALGAAALTRQLTPATVPAAHREAPAVPATPATPATPASSGGVYHSTEGHSSGSGATSTAPVVEHHEIHSSGSITVVSGTVDQSGPVHGSHGSVVGHPKPKPPATPKP